MRPGIASLDAFFFTLTEAEPRAEKFVEVSKMRKTDDGAPVAVTKAYDFVLWLLPKVENFPKAHKFTLGDRLSANGLDL